MRKRYMRILMCLGAGLLLIGLLVTMQSIQSISVQASTPTPISQGSIPTATSSNESWTIDTWFEFVQGTTNGIALHQPGSAQLGWAWWPNARVNDVTTNSKFSPRTSWVLSGSGSMSQTVWLVVWADEAQADHSPDIVIARSMNDGRVWSPDILIDDACDPDDPPYPDCPEHYGPDLTVRAKDNSVWVVWQQEEAGSGGDTGNIYYGTSNDLGLTWPVTGVVSNLTGKQHSPRIAAHAGTLYAIWEDESTDAGDIYIARYDPDVDSTWGAALKICGDTTGAEQRSPVVAADSSGNAYALWTDLRDNDDGEIYFSRWMSGAPWAEGSWSTAVRISDPGVDWATEPDIRTAADGTLYAAWKERVPTGPATYDFQIVVARSTDQGNTWTPTVAHRLLNASASNAYYANPSLGVVSRWRVSVAWLHSPDSQAATANVLVAASLDGGGHWGVPRRVNTQSTVSSDGMPSLAVDWNVHAVVAWPDYRLRSSTDIFAAGYPADRYLTSGEYYATRNIGGSATWGTLVWTSTVPADTGLTLASRVLVDPSTGWSEWVTHTLSGVTLTHPAGQAIQVRAVFTSTGSDTATLDAIRIGYERSYSVYLPVVNRDELMHPGALPHAEQRRDGGRHFHCGGPPFSAPHQLLSQGLRIDHADGTTRGKGEHLVEGLAEIRFIAILLDVSEVWSADGILQGQQRMVRHQVSAPLRRRRPQQSRGDRRAGQFPGQRARSVRPGSC